ncbi:hypothetical protein ABQE93_26775 [Mycolicibacterium sp. XJ662]
MAGCSKSPVVRSAEIELTEDDLHAIEDVVSVPAVFKMLALASVDETSCAVEQLRHLPEERIVHALMRVGIKTVVQQARNEIGYHQLSNDPDYQKHAHNLQLNRHLRRRPRHADDA